MYHAGLSYRRVERVIRRSYEAVRQWYQNLLFDPDPDHHSTIIIDNTKPTVVATEVCVCATIDVEAFAVIHIEVLSGRSDLDVLLFIKQVLKRCRGDPVVLVDRGLWYK